MNGNFNLIRLRWIQGAVIVCLAIFGVAGCGGLCLCGTVDKNGKTCCQEWADSYRYTPTVRLCSGSLPVDDKGTILDGWIVTNKFTESGCGSGMLNEHEWTNYANKPGTYPDLESVAICADDIRTGKPLTQQYVATGFRMQAPNKCPSSARFSVVRLTRYDVGPNGAALPSGSLITVCDGAGVWSSPPSGFAASGSKIRSFDCDNGVSAAVNAQVYRKL
jgi:hypothetical protein